MVSISAVNSRSPCPLTYFNFLMATTLPSFNWALYTSPKPPDPIRLSLWKLLVASRRSAKVSFLRGFSKVARLMLNASRILVSFQSVCAVPEKEWLSISREASDFFLLFFASMATISKAMMQKRENNNPIATLPATDACLRWDLCWFALELDAEPHLARGYPQRPELFANLRSCVIPPNSSKFPAPWHSLLPSFLMYTYCFPVSNAIAILPDCLNRAGGIVPFNKLVLRSNHNKLLQYPNSAVAEAFGDTPRQVIEIKNQIFQGLQIHELRRDFPLQLIQPNDQILELRQGPKARWYWAMEQIILKVSRFTRLDNDSGKLPTKLLNEKSSVFKLVNLSRVSTGNPPEKLLLEISRSSKAEQATRYKYCKLPVGSLGTAPPNLLLVRLRKLRLGQEEREAPILPVNLLDERSRCCKVEQS
nr:hypothetical protein Itr_chr02CG10330 [Ipomoea trifida]